MAGSTGCFTKQEQNIVSISWNLEFWAFFVDSESHDDRLTSIRVSEHMKSMKTVQPNIPLRDVPGPGFPCRYEQWYQ